MNMTTIKSAAAYLLLVSALLASMTGCTTDATPAADSSSTASAPPSTSSPSAETSADPAAETVPPELASLVVTANGIGSLVMGEPIPALPESTALAVWDPEYCVTESRPVGDPWAGTWLANYPETTVEWSRTPVQPFTVTPEERVQDGPVIEFIVWTPELATAAGIHPGSTRAELEAAYPSFTSVTNAPMTDIYVLADPDGGTNELWFEVATEAYATNGQLPASIIDSVMWIHIMPSGYAPYSLTESDSRGGVCVA
jgi:hypothetical protein